MSERPRIICLMTGSIDGRLHPSRYTRSPDGTVADWSGVYEAAHDAFDADAWLVGRVTMAEMAKGEAHPPADFGRPARPVHVARRGARPVAVAPDPHGRLHVRDGTVGGDPVIVLLGAAVGDAHLAELAGDGVSYIVSPSAEVDLPATLAILRRDFGVETLLLEGGGSINGAFLAAGLVDELHVLVAPALDGGTKTQGIVGFGEDGLKGRVALSLLGCEPLAHGVVRLRYRVERA